MQNTTLRVIKQAKANYHKIVDEKIQQHINGFVHDRQCYLVLLDALSEFESVVAQAILSDTDF